VITHRLKPANYQIISVLDEIEKAISSVSFIEQFRNSNKSFIRTRLLPFKVIILFLLNLLQTAIQVELDNFFKIIEKSDTAVHKVTKSAFSQARRKLKFQAFIYLNQIIIDNFYSKFPYLTWQGMRLLAIDGTTLILPKSEEIIKKFKLRQNNEGANTFVIARALQIYDVLNHYTLSATFDANTYSEQVLFYRLINALKEGDLCLLDRGFPGHWIFAAILNRKADFCMRCKSTAFKQVKELLESGEKELITKIFPSYKSIKKLREYGLSEKPITVRFLVIDLEDGEKEVLVTSLLSKEKYDYQSFKELYHNRWPVEEKYKQLKHRIVIENFTGKSVECIYQDFHAKIFMANLSTLVAQPVHQTIKEKTKKRKRNYQINWTSALSYMRNCGFLLFLRDNVNELLENLQSLFSAAIDCIRPDRKFKRNIRYPKHYYMNYKPIS